MSIPFNSRRKRSSAENSNGRGIYPVTELLRLRRPVKKEEEAISLRVFQVLQIPKWILEDVEDEFVPPLSEEDKLEKELALEEVELEWIAEKTIEFFSELKVFYEPHAEFHRKMSDIDEYRKIKAELEDIEKSHHLAEFNDGFPPKTRFLSRKSMEVGAKVPETGVEYVNESLAFAAEKILDENVFPTNESKPFPGNFLSDYVGQIAKRMFRIYSILFSVCWLSLSESGKVKPTIFRFKKFYLFCKLFNLLNVEKEKLAFKEQKSRIQFDELDELFEDYLKTLK
eukprot:augustus_masked-scaffold_1-processed-gene-7.48-mRNA-1 protein AED:0.71 eAED:1.00 QI:0/-1/0/1/-1/1/1/0/283